MNANKVRKTGKISCFGAITLEPAPIQESFEMAEITAKERAFHRAKSHGGRIDSLEFEEDGLLMPAFQ